jgi:peroxin-14
LAPCLCFKYVRGRNSGSSINILSQKYLLPNLRPPAASAYEEDRDALTAQFDSAEALLKEIQTETAAVRSAVEAQKEKVEKTTEDVEAAVKEMRDGESKTRDEMREIREEVNNVREMLPKVTIRRCFLPYGL